MTRYRHHGGRVVGVAEPARRATRDSAPIISEYNESSGPRRAALPDPPEIVMPEPGSVLEARTHEPPLGMTAAEVARRNERYWMQASGLPEAERNRRAGVELQRSYDAFWAKKHAFAPYGAPARDEGSLWRTVAVLGQPDGAGDLSGTGEDGRNYRLLRTDGGFTLEREELEDVVLQPIGDRRAISSRDREAAGLKAMNERNAAFWAKLYR